MINPSQIINASTWSSLVINERKFYSPNPKILKQIALDPDAKFWLNTYTEFACVVVDLQKGTIFAVRDHFGLEPFFYSLEQGKFIFASNLPDMIQAITYTPQLLDSQITQMLLSCVRPIAQYSDKTNYKGIYRVEPGCMLRINPNLTYQKLAYWQLDLDADPIVYSKLEEYTEHFSELLLEGIKLQLDGHTKIAAEFSGGLDSSTVISGFKQLELEPDLYMHAAPHGSGAIDDSSYANAVVSHYGFSNFHGVEAEDFDLLEVSKWISQLFAGSPQYLFPIGANNIHKAVANAGHTVLFSGFGGDECVSAHAPLAICLSQYLAASNYRQAWHEINAYYECNKRNKPTWLRMSLTLLKNNYPKFFSSLQNLPEFYKLYQLGLDKIALKLNKPKASLGEYEQSLLQGAASGHVRLRIEESAIVAKAMGFSYKYPLLYPKLVEFCHRLPIEMKRKNGENRLLVRNYLAQYLPAEVYQKHQKVGSIMPATISKIKQEYVEGKYIKIFSNLPYSKELELLRTTYPVSLQAKVLQELMLYTLQNYTGKLD